MTPIWVLLVVAGIAVLGTLGGVVVTHYTTLARERVAAGRAEAARTFEHRRDAYVAYLKALTDYEDVVKLPYEEFEQVPAERLRELSMAANDATRTVFLFGRGKAPVQCWQMIDFLERLVEAGLGDLGREQIAERHFQVMQHIRHDLGVIEDLPVQGPEWDWGETERLGESARRSSR
jgi:hypothetical protein